MGSHHPARRITFLVTGESKAGIISGILKRSMASQLLPAAKVQPEQGYLEWYLDSMTAVKI
jgi:6-phosphogluconolactonase